MKKRLVSLFLVIVLAVGLTLPASADAEPGFGAVDLAELENATKVVTDAVAELKSAFPADQALTVSDIFNGFITVAQKGGIVLTAVNGSVNFLKLIGVMKDPNAEALVNIRTQLQSISDTITQMDRKLDDITTAMSRLQASQTFNARTEQAMLLQSSWQDFRYRYEEEGMDSLLAEYNAMLLNGLQSWCLNQTSGARTPGGIDNTKVVLLYDPDNGYELTFSAENSLPYDFPAGGRWLVLPESVLPDSVPWNVNRYRDSIADYIAQQIRAAADAGDMGIFECADFPAFTAEGAAALSDELIRQVAEDAVDTLVYRIAAAEINRDASFTLQVKRQFLNYCTHLLSADEGLDAVLKTLYLTHAFEGEITEDLKTFCSETAVKAGTYGAFAMNVLGLSDFATDADKTDVMSAYCQSLNTIGQARKNGLTGNPRYSYLTNTELYFAEVHFLGHATVDTKEDMATDTYRGSSADPMTVEFYGRFYDNPQPTISDLIGDDTALVLAYTLQSNGHAMDYKYLQQAACDYKLRDYDTIVTSYHREEDMATGSSAPLKAKRVIGSYFKDGSVVQLNSLPDDAETDYIRHRRMITGSLYDPATGAFESNKVLSALALYGESHTLWWHDETAILGGSPEQRSFTSSMTRTQQSYQYYFRYDYTQDVGYNTIVRRPAPVKLTASGAYSPLAAYSDLCETKYLTDPAPVDEPFSGASGAFPGKTVSPFDDVRTSDWFFDAVIWAADKGIAEGTGNNLYSPAQSCSRAQFLTFMWRACGCPAADAALTFEDTAEGAYYADALRWACAEGIASGVSDTRFSPDAPISREQAAVFLYRCARSQGFGLGEIREFPAGFTDSASVSAWAKEAMLWCCVNGIFNGSSLGALQPQAVTSRAQAAALLCRFFA